MLFSTLVRYYGWALVLLLVVSVGGGIGSGCTPIRPMTRQQARQERQSAKKFLKNKRDNSTQVIGSDAAALKQRAQQWDSYATQYRDRLAAIHQLRQQPKQQPVGDELTVTFDPFGAGVTAPRRVRYRQYILLKAVNINPYKYDILLDSKPFSYTYDSPAAPTAQVGGMAKTDNTRLNFTNISQLVFNYEKLVAALQARYQRDDWPDDNGQLYDQAKKVLTIDPVTAAEFISFRGEQLGLVNSEIQHQDATLKKLADKIKAVKPARGSSRLTPAQESELADYERRNKEESTLLAEMKSLQAAIGARMGDTGAIKQANVTKELEELAQVLLDSAHPWNSRLRSQVQAVAEGDEIELKLTLSKRPGYQVPPGREPGKLLEWKVVTQVTQRFRVSASAGAFVTGLRDYSYTLLEDSSKVIRRTTTSADTLYKRDKRIVRSNTQERVSIGFTGLTHFHYRLTPSFDVAASLGLGAQTTGLQVLTGLTILTGGEKQRLCLTGGLIGGKVSRLSGGYSEEQHIDKSISVVPTQSVNKLSWFVAITYNLTGSRQ